MGEERGEAFGTQKIQVKNEKSEGLLSKDDVAWLYFQFLSCVISNSNSPLCFSTKACILKVTLF